MIRRLVSLAIAILLILGVIVLLSNMGPEEGAVDNGVGDGGGQVGQDSTPEPHVEVASISNAILSSIYPAEEGVYIVYYEPSPEEGVSKVRLAKLGLDGSVSQEVYDLFRVEYGGESTLSIVYVDGVEVYLGRFIRRGSPLFLVFPIPIAFIPIDIEGIELYRVNLFNGSISTYTFPIDGFFIGLVEGYVIQLVDSGSAIEVFDIRSESIYRYDLGWSMTPYAYASTYSGGRITISLLSGDYIDDLDRLDFSLGVVEIDLSSMEAVKKDLYRQILIYGGVENVSYVSQLYIDGERREIYIYGGLKYVASGEESALQFIKVVDYDGVEKWFIQGGISPPENAFKIPLRLYAADGELLISWYNLSLYREGELIWNIPDWGGHERVFLREYGWGANQFLKMDGDIYILWSRYTGDDVESSRIYRVTNTGVEEVLNLDRYNLQRISLIPIDGELYGVAADRDEIKIIKLDI